MPKVICNCGEPNNDINPYCLKCKTPFRETKQTETETEAEQAGLFVKMPVLKVFLFSLCTVGFYDYFWFYKQWSAIRQTKNNYMHPLIAAVFKIITVFLIPEVLRKNSGPKGSYALEVPLLYLCGHSFVTWMIGRNAGAPVVLLVFAVQMLIRAFALAIMQKHINGSGSFYNEENNIETSDIICSVLTILLLGFGFCGEIAENKSVYRESRAENWQKYELAGNLTVNIPFNIERNYEREKELNANNGGDRQTYFSGSSADDAVSVSYIFTEYGKNYNIDWDVFISEKAEALSIDKNSVKVEYKMFGGITGRLFAWVNAENVHVSDIVLFDRNKKWEFVTASINNKKNIEAANKIINSVSVKNKQDTEA